MFREARSTGHDVVEDGQEMAKVTDLLVSSGVLVVGPSMSALVGRAMRKQYSLLVRDLLVHGDCEHPQARGLVHYISKLLQS